MKSAPDAWWSVLLVESSSQDLVSVSQINSKIILHVEDVGVHTFYLEEDVSDLHQLD